MKRIFTFGLMLTAVFALTNCTEELVDPTISKDEVTQENTTPEDKGIPFQVYASPGVDTKTSAYIDDVDGKLKTKWKAGDEITVFYALVKDGVEEKDLVLKQAIGTFKMSDNDEDIKNGRFSGFLPSNFQTSGVYNWYFVYGATSPNAAKKTATVNIGYASIEDEGGSIDHVAGINCPMYGSAKGISGTITPAIRMGHLANLIELKIENKTNYNTVSGAEPGDIVISNVGISYSTAGSWDKTEALTGGFTIDVLTGTLTKGNAVNNTMIYTLDEPIILKSMYDSDATNTKPTSATVYFVTAPMDLQTERTISGYKHISTEDEIKIEEYDKLTENQQKNYTPIIKRQDYLNFSINGSVRPVHESMYPAEDVVEGENEDVDKNKDEYASGSIQRLILPIKELQYTFESDGLDVTSQGRLKNDNDEVVDPQIKVITLQNYDTKEAIYKDVAPTTYKINGHASQNVYVIGRTGKATYKTVTNDDGTSYTILDPDDGVNKSCQGVITIRGFLKDLINALPIGFYATRYNNLPTAMTIERIDLKIPDYDKFTFLKWGWTEYDLLKGRSWMSASYGDVFNMIGFDLRNGITREFITNSLKIDAKTITFSGLIDIGDFDNNYSVIMYEDAAYKYMSDQDEGNVASYVSKFSASGYTATIQGLKDILNPTDYYSKGKYDDTTIDWSELAIETGNAIYNKILQILAQRSGFSEDTVSVAISLFGIKDVDSIMHFIRDMEFEIIIKTYPHPSYSDTFNPIVVWGMDANAPTIEVTTN